MDYNLTVENRFGPCQYGKTKTGENGTTVESQTLILAQCGRHLVAAAKTMATLSVVWPPVWPSAVRWRPYQGLRFNVFSRHIFYYEIISLPFTFGRAP